MKHFLLAIVCLALVAPALTQSPDESASRDDIVLLLRTMHSHDFMQKVMAAESAGMRQLVREQISKDRGTVPADFDNHFAKAMDELIKGMPLDDIEQALIPSYQRHFTHGDIQAMNAFYASPVGQKVLQELPAVMQEGMQDAMPVMSKYLTEWKDHLQKEIESTPAKNGKDGAPQN